VDVATLVALQQPTGLRLLHLVEQELGEGNALALGTRLRLEHPEALVAAALTQVTLRGAAAAKFGPDAQRMFFTRDALEQATTLAVAEHRAKRLAAARPTELVDLGCGLGGDLVALLRAGVPATGLDNDPLRVTLARANLAALGLSGDVYQADALEVDLGRYDVAYADPARRNARGRVFDPAGYEPAWSFVIRLLRGDACVKVAPAISHHLLPDGVEAEWVSERGEVKEAALWSGRLRSAARRATLLPGGQTLTEADDPGRAPVREPGRYLYEPDGAVIRAGLVTAVAAQVDGGLLDAKIAYVTSDRRVDTPFARGYSVLERLPYAEKPLRSYLRARDVGTLTIKKRGVEIEPETLRKRLGLRGERPATLVLTRFAGGKAGALLVQPLSDGGAGLVP
jgi:SAM-dependent methyltransferase